MLTNTPGAILNNSKADFPEALAVCATFIMRRSIFRCIVGLRLFTVTSSNLRLDSSDFGIMNVRGTLRSLISIFCCVLSTFSTRIETR
ncbi:hypothetical protein D3C81_1120840 [compost metagenome]